MSARLFPDFAVEIFGSMFVRVTFRKSYVSEQTNRSSELIVFKDGGLQYWVEGKQLWHKRVRV